ncbi:MAG: sugar phosphate isomerase/epimerase family protein [Candidatus Omnitrophota bacterium]|nr:sugar phosphate isomerase/epimerase family protein [Candidatus Omnitrophota bacterium]
MKLGLCSWSYHKSLESGRLDFNRLLEICANELKVGGVDIIADHLPRTDKKSLIAYKKMATDLHLTIACLSPGNNFGSPKPEERKKEVEAVKNWLEIGYILGAPVLRIFSGWPYPYEDKDKLWPLMVDCIKECEQKAKEVGIVLAIEPHNDGGFLPTSQDTLRLIKEIDSTWVRINLDTGNYQDADNYKGIEDTIGYAPHLHAKVHHISEEGKELEFDYERIFSIIKKAGYRGFISLEFEGQDLHNQDELKYIPRAIEMLKGVMQKYAN